MRDLLKWGQKLAIGCGKRSIDEVITITPSAVRQRRHTGISPSRPSSFDLDARSKQKILEFSRRRATPVSLQQMYTFGKDLTDEKLIELSRFIWRELPIRVSHRVNELFNLPYGLGTTASVTKVRNLYINQFMNLRAFTEPQTREDDERFTELLTEHLATMASTVPLMAMGIQEMMQQSSGFSPGLNDCPFLNDFLDKFYMSRIGTRVITGQHVALHKNAPEGWVGLIDGNCRPGDVVKRAYSDAKSLCYREYGRVPEIEIFDPNNVTFRYIPEHIHHMCFELLKNSMRAICETYDEEIDEDDLPKIKVVIVAGETEITIKIADEGGGIQREDLQKVWLYAFTTVKNLPDMDENISGLRRAPLAGFGYGLPISRLYARYFGGDLQLISMDGYGTDAYLYLSKLGNMDEFLPYPFDSAMTSKV